MVNSFSSFFSLSVDVSLLYGSASVHTYFHMYSHAPPPTDSHVGIGHCVFSCLLFFIACTLVLSNAASTVGQGLS